MKTMKTKSVRIKKPLIIVITATVLIIGFGVTAYATNLWPFTKNEDTTSPLLEDPNKNASKEDLTVPDETSTKTTDEIPINTTIAASIDTLRETDTAVTFTGSVNNKEAGGKCSITFSNPDSKPVIRTADATNNGEFSICGPIEIPINDFTLLGTWSATFRYYINDMQAVASKDIVIQ